MVMMATTATAAIIVAQADPGPSSPPALARASGDYLLRVKGTVVSPLPMAMPLSAIDAMAAGGISIIFQRG